MKRLTSKQVKNYMSWRTDEELKHCPDCIAEACNEVCYEFSYDNYGFHTGTGRHIIETIKEKYYEYENN